MTCHCEEGTDEAISPVPGAVCALCSSPVRDLPCSSPAHDLPCSSPVRDRAVSGAIHGLAPSPGGAYLAQARSMAYPARAQSVTGRFLAQVTDLRRAKEEAIWLKPGP